MPPPYASFVTPEWQLTGRAEELRFIDTATRRTDGPRGIVLAGAAEVGKTRLAREALVRAERLGMATRLATATASAPPLPLGAFTAVLGGNLGGDPASLLRQATDALLADSGRSGVVVGVDDAHLLDEMSALMVYQLGSGHHPGYRQHVLGRRRHEPSAAHGSYTRSKHQRPCRVCGRHYFAFTDRAASGQACGCAGIRGAGACGAESV